MESPPPGYNPGESLLQGGNAPLHAVQGGGGMVGGAYEDQSLLRGGENAVLHPISGGGRVEPPIEVVETELNSTSIQPEVLEPFKESLAKLDIAGGFAQLAELYSVFMINGSGYWKRYKKDGTSAGESVKLMTQANCGIRPRGALDDRIGQAGFDRLVYMIPKDTERIIVMPKVNGDIPTFCMCMTYIEELYSEIKAYNEAVDAEPDALKKGIKQNPDNTVILFPPPFYPAESEKELIKRFAMKIYELKHGAEPKFKNVFVMPQPTIRNKFIGCALSEGRNENTPLLNMLEPTYVIYPYMRVMNEKQVLNPTDTPAPIRYGGIVFSAAGEGEVDLPASNLPSRIAAVSELTRNGTVKSMAIIPNPKVEDAEIHRLYRALHVRLFGEGSTLKSNTVYTYNLITQKALKERQERKDASKDKQIFSPTDDEELDIVNIKYIRVPLGPNVFLFRLPTGENEVKDDWRQLKFTKDEARFLNELNLRRDILEAVFPGETVKDASGKETKKVWEDRLADFLEQIVQSKCFSDERLLTRSECMGAREFVHAVFNWFVLHDERISKLVEDEEKDKKRDLEFRMKEARTEAEEEAERLKKEREEMQQQLKEIIEKASMYGVNLSMNLEDLKKNPFKDSASGAGDAPLKSKKVIASFRDIPQEPVQQQGGAVTPLGNPIIEDSDDKNKRKIEITVLKKKTGVYGVGELTFVLKPGEDEVDVAKRVVDLLAKAYPGWEFMV